MFAMLVNPYYKEQQFSHKRGWTHQLPFYTTVLGLEALAAQGVRVHLLRYRNCTRRV